MTPDDQAEEVLESHIDELVGPVKQVSHEIVRINTGQPDSSASGGGPSFGPTNSG